MLERPQSRKKGVAHANLQKFCPTNSFKTRSWSFCHLLILHLSKLSVQLLPMAAASSRIACLAADVSLSVPQVQQSSIGTRMPLFCSSPESPGV